jgi:hypothetical protein
VGISDGDNSGFYIGMVLRAWNFYRLPLNAQHLSGYPALEKWHAPEKRQIWEVVTPHGPITRKPDIWHLAPSRSSDLADTTVPKVAPEESSLRCRKAAALHPRSPHLDRSPTRTYREGPVVIFLGVAGTIILLLYGIPMIGLPLARICSSISSGMRYDDSARRGLFCRAVD